MMKYKLDEFQADWAEMPRIDRKLIDHLKNKTVLVSGRNLARCLCYALLYQNELRPLNIRVIFFGDKSVFGDHFTSLTANEHFLFVDNDSLAEIKQLYYIIHTGICNEEIRDFARSLPEECSAAQAIAEAAGVCGAPVIYLSDSRIYGEPKRGRVYAENEYSGLDSLSPADFEGQLVRALETYLNCLKKQRGFELTTLRTGIILGARSGIKTSFDSVFEAAAKGKSCELFNSGRKYSFVYLTDVFGAILSAVSVLEKNQVYNIAAANASTGAIAAMLHDIYGAKITLTDEPDRSSCAIHTGKAETYGFTPAIDLETALELCVMSYMDDAENAALPNTHDGRLEEIQRVQLSLLKEVERICRKHDIKYFLGGGTLLGAVRHGGFIPWDDDSDIMMLREDYDKFLSVAQAELPPGFTLQTGDTDRNCFYEFAKIRVDGTLFATGFSREHKGMHNGIALDIFCHDNTSNSAFGRKLHIAMTLFTRALVFNKWNRRKTDNGSKLQTAFTNFCVRLFPLRFSYRLMNRTISFYKRKKNARYLYDGMGRNVYNGAFSKELLSKAVYMDFEDTRLPVPERYDEYLRYLYGDYTRPAPLSTRLGCHVIPLCDLGKYDF